MPKYKITGPDGKSYEVNAPDGASEQDVLAYAQRSFKMAAAPARKKGFGEDLSDALTDVPRQIGMTARYGIEGVGDLFDAFVGNPVRTLAAPIFGNAPRARTGAAIADAVGLPQPQTATERIVGDATRLVAGGSGMLAGASKVGQLTNGATQGVARMLAANPTQQLASAGAAGLAGGYTRETGGGDGAQLVASLAAGLAAPAALGGAQRVATNVANRMRPATPTPEQAQQINITINNALQQSGITLDQLPAQVAQSIRNDVAAAFRTSDQVSPDAIRRLADYRLTGLTPTAAGLTLDPAIVTQQRNLAKLGINSKDRVAQELGQTQGRNNRALTSGLNNLGAATADDQIAGAEKVIGALAGRDARARQLIGDRYAQARAADGRSAMLDPHAFTQRASDMLDEALLSGKLPGDVRNLLNRAATGELPLTVDVAEQFKTRIGELQRSTMDMAERKALGMVRSALDDTPLLPGQEIGQEAIGAFNSARSLNRKWMQIVERTPALQAVRDGVEPDKFVQQFIVGNGKPASVMGVAQLKSSIKSSPEAMQAVKDQITAHLKDRALNGAADEVGNFSQSAYNKALEAIGDRKLALFFSKDEINQMKAIGRVASYEQFQPAGSAVNNSNTAGTLGAFMLDRLANSSLLSKAPVLGPLVQPAVQNIRIGQQAGRALDVPATLAGPRVRQPLLGTGSGLMVSPAAFTSLESEEERQRRLLPPGR